MEEHKEERRGDHKEARRDDRRVRRTRAQLRKALAELLQEKSADVLSVTELTSRADLNRGTFYCHYKDIYDMLDQLEAETLEEFSALMDSYPAVRLREGLRPILEDVFLFIQRNLDLAASAMNLWGRSSFLERLKALLRDKVARDWSDLYHFSGDVQREHCLNFLVGGIIGLVQSWLEGGGRETPQEMAALAEALILHGIQPFGIQ